MNAEQRYDQIQTRLEGIDAALLDTNDLIKSQEGLNQGIHLDALLTGSAAGKKKAKDHIDALADLNETLDSLQADRAVLIEARQQVNTEIQADEVERTQAVELHLVDNLPDDIQDAEQAFVKVFAKYFALSHIQARRRGAHVDRQGLLNFAFNPERDGNAIAQFNSLVDQYRAEYHEKTEAAA